MAINTPLKECRARRCGWKFQNTVRGSERQCRKTMRKGAVEPNWRAPKSICMATGRVSARGRRGRHSDGRGLRGGRNRCEILESSMGFPKNAIGPILHKPQKKKRNRRRRNQKFGSPRNLGLRLPTEELAGEEKGEARPDRK